jgi:dTMP kinase
MSFIVVEGADAAGKQTQVQMLYDRLSKTMPLRSFDFPAYDTPFGMLVKKYLNGEFGQLAEVPPEVPSMLFALDRYQFRDDIVASLEAGDLVLMNRYTQSNFGYQGARFPNKVERDEFIAWIEKLEERLPQPDLVVFLHLDREISKRLMESRGRTKDIHETDDDFQEMVGSVYRELAAEREDWTLIDCKDGEGILPIEAINDKIIAQLRARKLIG